MVCPETKLPIRAEKLLLRAGIAHSTPSSDSQSHRNTNGGVSWWNFGPSLLSSSSTTGERGRSGSGVKGPRPILHLLTKPLESSSPLSPSSLLSGGGVYTKFEDLVSYLGGDVGKVSRVYAIDHPSQRTSLKTTGL